MQRPSKASYILTDKQVRRRCTKIKKH